MTSFNVTMEVMKENDEFEKFLDFPKRGVYLIRAVNTPEEPYRVNPPQRNNQEGLAK